MAADQRPRAGKSQKSNRPARAPAVGSQRSRRPISLSDPFPVVIGASAGGLGAVSELLGALPPATGLAFVDVASQIGDGTTVSLCLPIPDAAAQE